MFTANSLGLLAAEGPAIVEAINRAENLDMLTQAIAAELGGSKAGGAIELGLEASGLQPTSRAAYLAALAAVSVLLAHDLG